MAGLHVIQKYPDLFPDTFLFAAHTAYRKKTLGTRVLRGKIFGDIDQRPDQPETALLRLGHGRKRGDAAVEKNIAQQRFRTIVRGMTEREDTAAQLRSNLIQVAPAMPAADVAAMRDAS